MSGAGNDFIVLDNRQYGFTDRELSRLAERFCPRRTGVGADGLLALNPAEDGRHDYRMRYFNADGSHATMCGNGARCLARFARIRGLGSSLVSVASDAGTYTVEEAEGDRMRLRLAVPEGPKEIEPEELPDPVCRPVYQVWAGTEHAVVFVDRVDKIPVEEWGRTLRRDPIFEPEGTNVNFVELEEGTDGPGDQRPVEEAPDRAARIRVRTFEKGVEAETLACGTGAVASAWSTFALHARDVRRVQVEVEGGRLDVTWEGSDPDHVFLEGEARVVYEGELDPPF